MKEKQELEKIAPGGIKRREFDYNIVHAMQKRILRPIYRLVCEDAYVRILTDLEAGQEDEPLNIWHKTWADLSIEPIAKTSLGVESTIFKLGLVTTDNPELPESSLTPKMLDTELAIRISVSAVKKADYDAAAEGVDEPPRFVVAPYVTRNEDGQRIVTHMVVATSIRWLLRSESGEMIEVDQSTWGTEFDRIIDETGIKAKI